MQHACCTIAAPLVSLHSMAYTSLCLLIKHYRCTASGEHTLWRVWFGPAGSWQCERGPHCVTPNAATDSKHKLTPMQRLPVS